MGATFLKLVEKRAQANPAKVVFPETFDDRTLHAVAKVVALKTAHPVLVGSPDVLMKKFTELGHTISMDQVTIIDPSDAARKERYAEALFELRKEKGMTITDARTLMNDLNYFSVMIVQMGDADGMVTGANSPSHDTLRPALQIIKTKEKFHKVSGFFFMVLQNRLLLFADCMVNIEPTPEELSDIAIDTAETARRFGIEPKIAMLSFSTNGSAQDPHVDRVREATRLVQTKRPDLLCEGEMQVDAALVPEIAQKKFPTSKIAGDANILIFPNLEAANISYKLVERLGNAQAIGPILQGLKKPVNDLSRGCSVEDIVHLAAITSIEAHEESIPEVGTFCKLR